MECFKGIAFDAMDDMIELCTGKGYSTGGYGRVASVVHVKMALGTGYARNRCIVLRLARFLGHDADDMERRQQRVRSGRLQNRTSTRRRSYRTHLTTESRLQYNVCVPGLNLSLSRIEFCPEPFLTLLLVSYCTVAPFNSRATCIVRGVQTVLWSMSNPLLIAHALWTQVTTHVHWREAYRWNRLRSSAGCMCVRAPVIP